MRKVQFRGVEYVLVGDLEDGGPIALADDYRTGRCSFAHLYPDGHISRFGAAIGTRDDLTDLGEIEDIEPDEGAFDEMLFGSTFPAKAQLAMMSTFLRALGPRDAGEE